MHPLHLLLLFSTTLALPNQQPLNLPTLRLPSPSPSSKACTTRCLLPATSCSTSCYVPHPTTTPTPFEPATRHSREPFPARPASISELIPAHPLTRSTPGPDYIVEHWVDEMELQKAVPDPVGAYGRNDQRNVDDHRTREGRTREGRVKAPSEYEFEVELELGERTDRRGENGRKGLVDGSEGNMANGNKKVTTKDAPCGMLGVMEMLIWLLTGRTQKKH
ncbi:hypothetical protein K461DRAFT_128483 [Myriangium duriaei CBS 260.36]|uniref:Uncharacterized protein n=1 Tax=Myriangium duriaei CBS 260.36 TaxID=1168546 RepID=A0A9P4J2Q3_9PEZI|nr:hypothetical protein K461DRAFT_128483 [Myriangium duriaei CBS 260.36]